MALTKADNSRPLSPTDEYGNVPTINNPVFEFFATATISIQKIYTLANRPAASSSNIGMPILVVDATPSEMIQYSDGMNWISFKYQS